MLSAGANYIFHERGDIWRLCNSNLLLYLSSSRILCDFQYNFDTDIFVLF